MLVDMEYVKKKQYVVYKDKVYDIRSFAESHPGGADIILDNLGMDITQLFDGVGHSSTALNMLDDYYICDLNEEIKDRKYNYYIFIIIFLFSLFIAYIINHWRDKKKKD